MVYELVIVVVVKLKIFAFFCVWHHSAQAQIDDWFMVIEMFILLVESSSHKLWFRVCDCSFFELESTVDGPCSFAFIWMSTFPCAISFCGADVNSCWFFMILPSSSFTVLNWSFFVKSCWAAALIKYRRECKLIYMSLNYRKSIPMFMSGHNFWFM